MNQNYQCLDTGTSTGSKSRKHAWRHAPDSGFANRSRLPGRNPVNAKSLVTASLMLFLLLFNVSAVFGQAVTGYSQVPGTGGTLDPMAGSTQLVAASSDDGNSSLTAIGFTFNFAGTNYTQFSASANGFIRLGATPATGSTNYSNSTSNGGSQSPAILTYWDDLATGVGGKVHYVLSGSSPNRILKVEWSVTVPRVTSAAANAKFQAWLYEGTNEIKFIYGPGMVVNSTNSGYSIGLITSSSVYHSVVGGVSSTTTFATTTTAAIPEGTTYTFTPPLPCNGTPSGGTVATTSQNVCSGSTPSAISPTGYSTGLPGLSYQWEQSTNGTDWGNATGGTGATTASYTPPSYAGTPIQYRLKVTCSNGGGIGYSNAVSISTVAPATQASNAAVVGYNSTSSSLSWTSGNGNRRMVIFSNAPITDPTNGSGAALTASAAYSGSGQQIVYDGTGTSVTVTGLTTGTYYAKVYDYQRCGSSAPYTYTYNITSGTNAVTVNNTCTVINSFPWTEGFESVTTASTVVNGAVGLPNCWSSGSSQWSSTNGTTYNTARTGTKYIRYAWSSTNAFMWTPGFQLEAGTSYDFIFYAQGDGYTSWNNGIFVNTSQASAGATELTPSYSPTGPGSQVIQSYNKVTRTFVPSTSGVYYFAIRGNESTGSPWYMAFDDFELRLTPNCVTPSALTATPTSATTANVSWTAPVTGTTPVGFEYAVTTSATPPASGTYTTSLSATGVTITENTAYYLHVRSVCEVGVEFSAWSTSASFKYVAGDNCSNAINLATLTSPYNGDTTDASSDFSFACNTNTDRDLIFYIDVMPNYTLTIGQTANGYDSENYIYYGDTCPGTTQIACYDDPDTTTTNWMNTTGATQRVYYIQDGYLSGNFGTFTLAWSLTPPPACVPPTALTPVVNGTSATISWTAADPAPVNGYEYEVRTSGAAGSGATGRTATGIVTTLQTPAITGLTVGTTYTVYVRSLCDGSNSSWNSQTFLVPAPNDTCANAITVTCGSSVTGSTVGATNENMTVCGISGVTAQNTPGIWYKFTGDGSDVTFSTCAVGTGDTRIAIYTGVCGTMTCVAGNDDNGACTAATLSSEVLLSTTPGTEYYILMYAYSFSSPATNTVSFTLNVSCVVPCTPANGNDECASATALTLGSALASNNTCSTPSAGVAYPSCGSSFATYYDSWYSFNSGSNTLLEVSAVATAPTAVGYILYSGACGSLTPVGSSCFTNGAANNITVTADTNYYVRVYTNGSANRGDFTITVKVPCIRPTGVAASAVTTTTATISWTAATPVPGTGYEYEVRTSGAAGSGATGLAATGIITGTSVDLTSLASDIQHSVYVRSVCGAGDYSPWTSVVTFTTLPTCVRPTAVNATNVASTTATIGWTAPSPAPSNGYQWEVRTSGAAGSGTNGLFGTSTATGTSVNLTSLNPSTTYSIYVRSHCDGSDYGAWTTAVTFKTKVVNDVCSAAINLTCGATTTGSTTDATNENMAVCGISGLTEQNSAGIWYKFTGTGQDITVSTCSPTQTDTRMAIFTGSCGTMTCIGGNDDNSACTTATFSSEVLVSNTQVGTVYYVLVYGFSDTTPVSFNLSLTCAAACSPATMNDTCATATTIGMGTTTAANNSCATASTGTAYPSCDSSFATYYDTWFKFNTGANTVVNLSASATAPTVVGFAVYSGACGSLTQVGCNITGAATSVSGLTPHTVYYIRAYSKSPAARGAFSINLTVPCNAPTGVTSVNSATSTVLSWNASSSIPQGGYDYEVRTSGAAGSGATGLAASGNTSNLSATVTGLTANTSYSVYVRSVCGSGDNSSWTAAYTLLTGYCTPAPSSVSGTGITNVTFSTVNNTTGAEAGNYADYTAMEGTAVRTEPLTVNVTFGTAQYLKIWIDTNNDLDFDDSGELVYTSATASTSFAAEVNIPSTTMLGSRRMRIGGRSTSSTFTPCFTGTNASFEDYSLNVTSMGDAHLISSQCDATVNSFNTDIFSNFVVGATQYRFRVRQGNNTPEILTMSNRWFKLNMLSSYSYGAIYLVDVSVNVNGIWSDYGSACKITVENKISQLRNCGAVISNFNDPIYAVNIQNATSYRFKVVTGGQTYIIDRPTDWFKLNMLPAYTYGATYNVSVDVLSGGVWSGYGPACNITSIGQLPTTQIRSADCNAVISSFNADIFADVVPLAQTYNFTVTSVYGTQTIVSNTNYFKLNMLSSYDYNVSYTISVTASAPGAVTSTPGAACTVMSPATPPTTQIRSADCGTTVPNRNVYVYADRVQGAVTYRFRVTSGAGTQTLNRPTNFFKVSQLLPGSIASGETFTVDVMVISANGSQSAYGSVCNITLSSLSGRPGSADSDGKPSVNVKGYPNPFTATFGVEITTESDEMVHIVIYDMSGKLVDKRDVQVSELPGLQIGDNFAAGVYNLIVTQGDTVKTIRVVKNIN